MDLIILFVVMCLAAVTVAMRVVRFYRWVFPRRFTVRQLLWVMLVISVAVALGVWQSKLNRKTRSRHLPQKNSTATQSQESK